MLQTSDRWPQGSATVMNEFTRHERLGRQFTMLQVGISGERGSGLLARRRLRRQAAAVVRSHVRRYDVVIGASDGTHVILAPECAAEDASSLVDRLLTALGRAGIEASGGSATYPSQGDSLQDLIAKSVPVEGASAPGSGGADHRSHRDRQPPGPSAGDGVGGPAQIAELAPWLIRHPRHGELNSRRRRLSKRAVDIALVGLATPVWLPLLSLCALAVWAAAPGAPVFFRQKRTGEGNRSIEVLKLRTMVPNAEELKVELAHLNERTPPDFKITDDPRVTRLGRFLRTTSLDELPQMLNVLRGNMSLVGPRPHSTAPLDYDDWHRLRLAVTPGLTGLWQVSGRGLASFDDRVRLDIAYIERRSCRLDLAIILRTIPAVVTQRGAA